MLGDLDRVERRTTEELVARPDLRTKAAADP